MTGRPSVFTAEFLSTARRVVVTEYLIRHKLTDVLPPQLGTILAAQRETLLEQLWKLADERTPLLQPQYIAVSLLAAAVAL